jgi:hypothetical protein
MSEENDRLIEVGVEDGENEWVWWSELKEIIRDADEMKVREEDFHLIEPILDITVDDDGFIKWADSGDYVKPYVPTEVDGTIEFVPVKDVAHESPMTRFTDSVMG